MIAGHGEPAVARWLADLPSLLDAWCRRWDVAIAPEPYPVSYNLVLFGTSARAGEVVLKLNLPSSEVASEIEALRQAAGDGMVRLIDADPTAAILMLERIRPGTMLLDAGLPDDDCTRIAAETMRRMGRAPARRDNLHPLRPWFQSLYGYPAKYGEAGPIPATLAQRAIGIADQLLADPQEPVLLHGDLHHQNILRGAGGWVTIDPKGLVGERGYEVATWMLNPPGLDERPDLEAVLANRLNLFARELAIDRRRLTAWTLMHAVLSMCWTLEDDGMRDFAGALRCTAALTALLNE